MSQYSNRPSTAAGVIESVGRDLAEDRTNHTTRGSLPRAKRHSDRPMDLRLERPSIVIDDQDFAEGTETAIAQPPIEAQPITTRMRRMS